MPPETSPCPKQVTYRVQRSRFFSRSTDLFVTYLGLFGLCVSDLQGVVRGQPPLVPVCVHIGVHPVIRPVSPLVFAATVSTLRHLSRRKTGPLRGTAAARPLLAWNKVFPLDGLRSTNAIISYCMDDSSVHIADMEIVAGSDLPT